MFYIDLLIITLFIFLFAILFVVGNLSFLTKTKKYQSKKVKHFDYKL